MGIKAVIEAEVKAAEGDVKRVEEEIKAAVEGVVNRFRGWITHASVSGGAIDDTDLTPDESERDPSRPAYEAQGSHNLHTPGEPVETVVVGDRQALDDEVKAGDNEVKAGEAPKTTAKPKTPTAVPDNPTA